MVAAHRSAITKAFAKSLVLPSVAAAGLLCGAVVWTAAPAMAGRVWLAVLVATGSVVVGHTVAGVFRGQWASDIIATLAIVTAAVTDEPLPGLVVVLMQTGGEALERFAEGRASGAVRALEADRPEQAHRLVQDAVAGERVVDITAADVNVGDVLVVRPGELVPCDGIVTRDHAEVDTSRLTGEPLPVLVSPGDVVRSGSVNGARPFVMRSTARAAESQYAHVVELVRSAQATKAPFQRIADRYAVWFTPFTLVVAAMAALVSGKFDRVLAVLVVATPCPLILAPPVAMIGGINRAARRQIVVRTGATIEQLARVDVAVFDKTGTLTVGKPTVRDVNAIPPFTRATLLQRAGSVEQGSSHLLARTLVDAAVAEAIALSPARDVVESAGRGVVGRVDADIVAVGSRTFVSAYLGADARDALTRAPEEAGLLAYVAVNGGLAGTVAYADRVRTGVAEVLDDLRALGIRRMLLLTGDHAANAQAVAHAVGIADVRSHLMPEDKVTAVRELTNQGATVLMVGDGTNDAPALSAAAVGVALAGHGGGVTAEAADVVVLVDDLERLPESIRISQRTMAIARQSMWAGVALSAIAMGGASLGYIVPAVGAVLQEAIDVAVIVNALRTSVGPRGRRPARMPHVTPLLSSQEHHV